MPLTTGDEHFWNTFGNYDEEITRIFKNAETTRPLFERGLRTSSANNPGQLRATFQTETFWHRNGSNLEESPLPAKHCAFAIVKGLECS